MFRLKTLPASISTQMLFLAAFALWLCLWAKIKCDKN